MQPGPLDVFGNFRLFLFQVVVYYDAQGVVGFVFSLGGGNTATLGTTSTAGGVLTQTIQPTGGVQGYVSYMDVVIQNSRIIGVDVSFQRLSAI